MHFKIWDLCFKFFGVCFHVEIKNLLQQYTVKVQKSMPILDLIKIMCNIFNLRRYIVSTLFLVGCQN